MKVLAVLLLAVAACQGAVYQRDNRPVVEEYVFKTEPKSHDVKSLLNQVFQDVETFPHDYRESVQDPRIRSKITEYEFNKYGIPELSERYRDINMPYGLRMIKDPSIRDVKMQTMDQFSLEGQKLPSLFQSEKELDQSLQDVKQYRPEERQTMHQYQKEQQKQLGQIEQYQRDGTLLDQLKKEERKQVDQHQKQEPLSKIEQSKKLQQLKETQKIEDQQLLRKDQEIKKLDQVLRKELQQNDQQLEQVDKRMHKQLDQVDKQMHQQSVQSKPQEQDNRQWKQNDQRNDQSKTKTRDQVSQLVYDQKRREQQSKEQILKQLEPSLTQQSIENIFQQQVPMTGRSDMSRLFPTGEAILDMMLEQYPWYQPLKKEDIKEFTGLNQTFLKIIIEALPEVSKNVDQPTSLAVVYTKAVIQEVMYARLRCPSVVLDKVLMRQAKKNLVNIMSEHNKVNRRFLELSLGKLEGLDESLVLQLSKDGASQMDYDVFYNIMHYIVSRHLEDVERLSHTLFRQLLSFFKIYLDNRRTDIPDLSALIQDSIKECDVKCPTGNRMNFINQYVFWDVTHRFIPDSAESLTNRLEQTFYRQIFMHFVSKSQPFPNDIFRIISEQMHPETFRMAEYYYRSGVQLVQNYEQVVIPTKATNYMRYIRNTITPEERSVVVYALEKLGWILGSETSKPRSQRQQNDHSQY